MFRNYVIFSRTRARGEGIMENGSFSINLPGKDLVTETDYCGIVSGRNEDKARLFKIFYSEAENAPMIQGCPINYDLKLAETVELPGTYLFIGEIVGAYVDEDKRKGHMPDVPQAEPFMLVESPPNDYFQLGHWAADAFNVGKKLKQNT